MEVEFQVSKEDYIDYCKTQLKENFQKKIVVITILLFFVISAVYTDHHFDWQKTVIAIFCYAGLISLLFYFVPFGLCNYQLKKLIDSEPGYSERKRWIIEEEGLRSKSESNDSLRTWVSLSNAKASEKYITITLVDKRVLLLPKDNFSSDADATNFFGLIQSKILKAQGLTNLIVNQRNGFYKVKEKPPYIAGLAGVVPLIGAFVGVGLILYGIFKYKDKLLVLIGVAGICVTIAVYSFLNYADKRNLFGGGFVDMDKGKLNSLVKEIEFYKMQKGAYPDSLEQLDIKNQFVNFYDPLMSHEKNNRFNYHLIGKGYTIFSSGIDKTPHTKDDIYPTLEIDTSKMGLIIDTR